MSKTTLRFLLLAILISVCGSCKKEIIDKLPDIEPPTIFDRIRTDGNILIFENLSDYEALVDGATEIELKTDLIDHIRGLQFPNYFSKPRDIPKQNFIDPDIQEMDEFFGTLLNAQGVVQIGDFLYKVNLEKKKVYSLPASLYPTDYQDLSDELTIGTSVIEYSTDEDVLYLNGIGCGGAKAFCRDSPLFQGGGLLGGESVFFRAKYFKGGIYFSVKIVGRQRPNGLGAYFTSPILKFEIKTESPDWKSMRMKPKPCDGNNIYHSGGMRDFTGHGTFSSDALGRYQVWHGYEKARGLNGYNIWIRGYCNGVLTHTDWVGREQNKNF